MLPTPNRHPGLDPGQGTLGAEGSIPSSCPPTNRHPGFNPGQGMLGGGDGAALSEHTLPRVKPGVTGGWWGKCWCKSTSEQEWKREAGSENTNLSPPPPPTPYSPHEPVHMDASATNVWA